MLACKVHAASTWLAAMLLRPPHEQQQGHEGVARSVGADDSSS